MAPPTIGPHVVLGALGQGGAGYVVRARSPQGQDLAIKILRRLAPDALARFERERRLQSALGFEKGFVPLLEAGDSPQGPYIVMPFLPGGTLRERLVRGPLGIDETVALGRTLARSLAHAHALGVIHRDLKPENVLFHQGRPVIADLGLARHFRSDVPGASQSRSVTQAGGVLGTPGYMPVDQIEGKGEVGPPVDVFALGAILYECLTGGPAFPGSTFIEIMARVESGSFEPVSSHREDAPPWLAAAVERALARDPGERFSDASAFLRALEPKAPRRSKVPLVLVAVAVVAGGAVLVHRAWRASVLRDLVRRAEALDYAHDSVGALALADQALELDPALGRAWAVKADATFDRSGATAIDRTIEYATRAIELDPGAALAWGARGTARQTRGEEKLALADFDRAVALDPKNAIWWLNRSVSKFRGGDPKGAMADASRAIELDPHLAMAWFNRAHMSRIAGDRKGAAADLARATEVDPKMARAYAERALVRLEDGDTDGGIADADKAIALDSRLAVAYRARSAALADGKGDLAGAKRDCLRALELEPRNRDALDILLGLATKAQDVSAMIDAASRLIEVAPDSARAWSIRSWAKLQRGDVDGAISDATRSLAIEPRNLGGLVNRAQAYCHEDRFKEAYADASLAVEVDPSSAWALTYRGYSRSHLGEVNEGRADCERALEMLPGDAQLILHRGITRQKAGDVPGAMDDYELFAKTNPAHPNAAAFAEIARKYRAQHPR
ncbi:MAG TPA: protein kinase [Planctomycetota bacterium]|nr:protein kinase [Planctomycetota bacterium]